ncbi:MAG: hypothetical protein ACXVUE_18960 [Solirubrobacteraceae bacterium]
MVGVIGALSLLCACGSNQVKAKLAADTTTTETKTVTEPARTVTTPARTETKTVTEPGRTTTIESHTTTVAVKPTTSTTGQGSSGGIPSWGWILIGAGAVLLVVAIFMIGRSHGERRRDIGPARPGPRSDRDQPPAPPRGPPQDPI